MHFVIINKRKLKFERKYMKILKESQNVMAEIFENFSVSVGKQHG